MLSVCRVRDEIRDEPLFTGFVLSRHHQGLSHPRQGRQRRLDFPQFDPETPDLHLRIDAPQVFQRAVRQEARQVAAAVQPRLAILAERVADEAPCRQFRLVQVAASHARPADAQLPRHPDRHRIQVRIQHMDRQIRDRPPDPRRRSTAFGAQGPIRHVHRRLGDAVHVDELAIAVARILVPGAQHPDFQCLPAEHHVTQLVLAIALGLCRDQLTERARRLVQHRHAGIAKQRVTRLRRAARQLRHDHQPAAVQQRAPDLPDREVEGERVEQRPGVLRAEAVPGLRGREQPRHVAVLDHHALRLSRRTRGVDHISEAAGSQPFHHRVVARRAAFARRIDIDHRHRQPAQHLARAGLHQHRQRRAVAQRVSEPLGRVSRVQRHVTGAGLQHPQQPGDHARAALHADRHAIVRLHAQPDQAMRDAIGPGVQLAVAQTPPLEFQRDRVRRLRGTGLEQAMKRVFAFKRSHVAIPGFHHLLPFMRRQQVDAVMSGLCIVRDCPQGIQVISKDPLALSRRQTRRINLDIHGQAVRHIREIDQQREVGRLECVPVARLEAGMPRQGFVDVEIDVVEGHLVQRGAIVVELDLEVRVMAMTDHLQLGAEGLADQLGPARRLQFLAQRQGIQEQAQHLLAIVLLLAHVGHQAGGDIQFARQHRQHPQVRGQQHAAHRHAQAIRHGLQAGTQAAIDGHAQFGPRDIGSRTGLRRRQAAERVAGERVSPELAMRLGGERAALAFHRAARGARERRQGKLGRVAVE